MVAIPTLVEWLIVGLAFGSTLLGGYVGYQAYRGYRRHDSRSMRYLSAGLFCLTAVAFAVAFVGSLLLRQGVLPVRFQQPLTLVTRAFQFVGVLFIAYSLHTRE
ncbi:DUF7521 family protein [Haloarcula salina]|uniref:Uncharacterized protein n=1 Tax=Haloarcula salina TaxID=1429914 RepID=A0AA41G0L5_9EURY|nr:hypothetical protein [Haloarcula salina]MBV0902210.1 hypothetical protein [Haloarcula salina]